MGVITVDYLRPDMKLAEDLRNRNGRFLLSKGTSLTEKHLRILKIWGVIEADIEGISKEDLEGNGTGNIDPARLMAAEEQIRGRFIHVDLSRSPNRELFRLCALRKARTMTATSSKRAPSQPGVPSPEELPGREPPFDATVQVDPLKLINENVSLSTLPTIIAQINETIRKPNSSSRDIAGVISKDTSLSARLLKIVNSTFYGYPSKIDSLSRAVLIIGTKQLCTLAMGLKIISFFKSIPSELIDMKSFLEHSVACGIVARILASHKNIQNMERLFVGGLLHDIGRLVLYNHVPDEARFMLTRARTANELLYKIEPKTMRCDHARVGALLLKKWKLPVSLENMVGHHHDPLRSKDPLEPTVIHLADIIVNALEIGSSGERLVPSADRMTWGYLGLSPNALPIITQELECQFEEIARFLLEDN
jgi:putative nucleotidyltransferase with HDIG domain